MTTEVKNGGQPKSVELAVPRVKAGGWLAWSKVDGLPWTPVYPRGATNDWMRHPNPLHASKEAAVAAAQEQASGVLQGGFIKVFYIELDE